MRMGKALKLKLDPSKKRCAFCRSSPIAMGVGLQAWRAVSRGPGLIIVRLVRLLLSHLQKERGLTKCVERYMCEI